MSEERITTKSVARDVVHTDPIVLRETENRRLVFNPLIVDKTDAPVKGYFVYQRKKGSDEWEDIKGETLASLKAGEGYQLALHTEEVNALIQGIAARKEIYKKYGIQFGQKDYFAGVALPEVVRKILEEPESELANALQALDPNSLLALGRTVELSKLDALLAQWNANDDNNDEEFWQTLLTQNAWVFSQLTGSPVVLLKAKAYVGGKDISNTGGGVVDYLLANALTENVSLVEIKTPGADLIESQYRSSGAHLPGRDLVGGVVQVLGYRDSFVSRLRSLRGAHDTFHAYNPHCYVIVGRALELPEDEGARRSFELFRSAQAGVHVLTFDEVKVRLQGIRDVLVAGEDIGGEFVAGDGVIIPAQEPTNVSEGLARPKPVISDLRK